MDHRSFDRLARLLGEASDRRAGLKAALAAVLGGPAAVAALEARTEAKRTDADRDRDGQGRDTDGRAGRRDATAPAVGTRKRRKTCKPACTAGFACVKVGKKRECVCQTGVTCGAACCALGQSCVDGACRAAACDPPCANGFVCEGAACVCPSGVECGDACCADGQTCQDGTCAGRPDPDACIAFGERCKNAGRPCCEGLTCASGQDGTPDVACYRPVGEPCAATAECVYGLECRGGVCASPPPAGVGEPCGGPGQVQCADPATTCQAYSVPDAPAGSFCTLPLQAICTGSPDCSCYRCGYPTEPVPEANRSGRRQSRATVATTCCGVAGQTCSSNRDCCEGTACRGGSCVANACTVCAGGGCAYPTIAAAISGGETDIRIAGGTYPEHDLPAPAGSSLTLRPCSASPVTIDGQQQGRIMQPIAAGTSVTVRGITVVNGKPASGWGGAFAVSVGALELDGVTVADSAAEQGGCIYNDNGRLEVRNSTITRCTATGYYGGGILSGYSTAYRPTNGTLTVTDSEISWSSCGSDGGGLAAYGDSATLRRVHVRHNESGRRVRTHRDDEVVWEGFGGGIELGAVSSTLENCEITDNVANQGGGVHAWQGNSPLITVRITGGRIANNAARATPRNPGLGGGINTWASLTTLTDVEVSGNTADKHVHKRPKFDQLGQGGGIWVKPTSLQRRLVLAGSTRIENNVADGMGGGIYTAGTVETAAGSTVRIAGNRAAGIGGGVYVDSGAVTLGAATQVTGNVATGWAGHAGAGGGLHMYAGRIALEGQASVSDNAVESSNPKRNALGGGISQKAGTLDLRNAAPGAIHGNHAQSATEEVTGKNNVGHGVAGLSWGDPVHGSVLAPAGGIASVVAADNLPYRCGGKVLQGDCALEP